MWLKLELGQAMKPPVHFLVIAPLGQREAIAQRAAPKAIALSWVC